MTMRVGVAVRDLTPARAYLSGFAARTQAATTAHDPITVRALAVGRTAVVTVDVCGLDEPTCAAIRAASPLPDDQVLVHALHTHGGPASMPGRLERRVDHAWLARLVDEAAATVAGALAGQVECRLSRGVALDPGVARNRRRPDGPVDAVIPVLAFDGPSGRVATVVAHACHPVVLGPDNLQFTADFPAEVRRRLELWHAGSVCLFLTGCAGDANTGHSAAASMRGEVSAERSFAEAERIGALIAEAADNAKLEASSSEPVAGRSLPVQVRIERVDERTLRAESARYAGLAREAGSAAQRALYGCWRDWAESQLGSPGPDQVQLPVSLLTWGDAHLVGLPGEPFADAARQARAILDDPGALVAGYTNGCHGYLPTAVEYPLGGYEVTDAHRYYGAAGPFRAGSAEALLGGLASMRPASTQPLLDGHHGLA